MLVPAVLMLWPVTASAAAAAASATTSHAPVGVTRSVMSFDRASFPDPAVREKLRKAGNLAGIPGMLEYDFEVPADGWYELLLDGNGWEVELFIDPRGPEPGKAAYYLAGSQSFDGATDKAGNYWLTRGRHTLRLQRWYWTGFPTLTGFRWQAGDGSVARSTRVSFTSGSRINRTGECGELEILSGPRMTPAVLPVHWFNLQNPTLRTGMVTLPASKGLHRQRIPVPCTAGGDYMYYFNGGPEKIANRDLAPLAYQVIDVNSRPQGDDTRELVQKIDPVATPPDYQSGGTRVSNSAAGSYRESSDTGWLDYQSSPIKLSEPGWFAYVLKGLRKQDTYVVEIDYPDDRERSFAIALRESQPLSYPVAGGVDTGGEFVLSQGRRTQSITFWPRAEDPRIVFMPAHNGDRAAATEIRVYRMTGRFAPLVSGAVRGRTFVNWYEEGSGFLSMYGAPEEGALGQRIAIERWMEAFTHMGGNMIWPTVSVYSFALYPSTINRAFSRPWSPDTLTQMLLLGEKYGVGVVPELHPRADELSWPYASAMEPRANRLADRNGKNWNDLPPFYSALDPGNRKWYLDMIGELVDRYAAMPALRGVSLRFMQWKNPALFNFHSLAWGYDDATFNLFVKETGLRAPFANAGSERFDHRYRWLTSSDMRERWIAWRCAKVTAIITSVRDRLRAARSDLVLYIPVFPMTEAGSRYNEGTAWLREAGIDVAALSKIDGVVLVNALHVYGRRQGGATKELLRRNLTEPARLKALMPDARPGAFLSTAMYFEATESIVPPERLGFPQNTKRTWMSAVVNPAGRNYLERFALPLAEGDARMLGDGGNAYTLGQPELREFLNEYRYLPDTPFTPRAAAKDPVAVWDLAEGNDYWFYAVNRTPRETKVTLRLSGSGSARRVSASEMLAVEGNDVELRLAPYQLLVYRAPRTLRVSAVSSR